MCVCVCVCALMTGCVYTERCAVLAGEQECYVLAIDFITLQGFSLSNTGFNLSPLKDQSTAVHNIHTKAIIIGGNYALTPYLLSGLVWKSVYDWGLLHIAKLV